MTESLVDRLARIGWTEIANHLDALLEDAAKDSLPYSRFVDMLLRLEEKSKEEKAFNYRLKQSRLPQVKTLESFDFSSQPTVDEKRIRDLVVREFPRDAQTFCFWVPLVWVKATWLLLSPTK
ncbi:MAG: ATP-binding protein [Peptococcaceae bacterium]|nr:ATP-binding protein [Peptococcaceae bacterium]